MSDTDRSSTPFNGWWYASAVLIVLVLLGAVAVVVLGGRDGQVDSPTPAATVGPSTAPSPDAATPSSGAGERPCDQAGSSEADVPSEAPDGVTWVAHDGVLVPVSEADGPSEREAGWACFSRTPTGALLAAVNISTQTSGADAAAVLERQVMPGPNRDAALREAQERPGQPADPGSRAAIAGFRFLAYSGDAATVQIAVALAGRYAVATTTVVWYEGDWRVDADPAGGLPAAVNPPSLQGYIAWAAA